MWGSRKKETPVPDELAQRVRGALALFDAGQYQHAAPLWRTLVADCERQLGPDHPETIRNVDRLGSVHFRLKELGVSMALHRDAHQRAVRALGRNNPETLSYAHNLGCVLVLIGDREAVPLLRDTLTRQRRKLGRLHEATITTGKTLGVFLFMTGDVRGAVSTLTEALGASRSAFGQNDPLTEDIAHQLGIVHRNSRSW